MPAQKTDLPITKERAPSRKPVLIIAASSPSSIGRCCFSFLAAANTKDIFRRVRYSGKKHRGAAIENLSRDPDNAFFTDGVQDEILTDLAKIADLKVISRTSAMQYKSGTPRNLREIGQQLGVAHLLEGSVQRAGNKVRVNAQLINARTDAHLGRRPMIAIGRCLRHSKRNRQGDCRPVAGEALA